MAYLSEDETDISDSELEDYVDRCYEQLRDGVKKVKVADEVYRCPFCPGKKKLVYEYKDLLQHATDVGKGSQNRDIKHKGKHLGLVKFMKTDLEPVDDISLELAGLTLEFPPPSDVNKLFVFPWMGILANVDSEVSISNLKNYLARKGFNLVRVRPLLKSKYAVVEFKKDWSGFYNAMSFEKDFKDDLSGKKEHSVLGDKVYSVLGGKLYGWVARDDDYNSKGVLGEYLQKNGDLKTVDDVEADEKRKTGLLVANLNKTIQELKMRVDELESNDRHSGITN